MQLCETYRSRQRPYLVLELAAGGDLGSDWGSEQRCSPGLDEQEPAATAPASRIGEGAAPPRPAPHPNRGHPPEPRASTSSPSPRRDLKCENILLGDRGLLKLTGELAAQPLPSSLHW